MSTPLLTTVICIEAILPVAVPDAVLQSDFVRLVVVTARQFGAVLNENAGPGYLQFSCVLQSDSAAGSALRRLASAMSEFSALHAGAHAHALVHHGVVFQSETSNGMSYVGSAIRSAQSTARRIGKHAGLFASRDFTQFASGWKQSPINLHELTAPAELQGLSRIGLVEAEAPAEGKPRGLASDDADFLAFIKKRLAQDLGPFAAALVDSAQRATGLAGQVVQEVASEIDNEPDRKKFLKEAQVWLKAREGGK